MAEFKNQNNSPVADQRNIEIKARVASKDEFQNRIEIACNLTKTNGTIINQHDVFFNAKQGRFKLRYLIPPPLSQLVYYDRPDEKGPKLSKYNKMDTSEPEVLEKILELTNGKQGVLKKERLLFMHKSTRIHLDNVVDLGYFIEFEVCLEQDQTIEEGQAVAEELIKIFKITPDDLMTGSYIDELIKKSKM